ncbi:phosphoenolpyruvate mutase [Candidatus Uhrbacteria bacterium RIFCSPLOWO2_01_FULL_47_24]|uniref:phosphoenolpyruvate mutase n=1 Tax=Candidatus Uhrbacteria bacterium RIFCSPLOWO2_01_FULL_47_24 TaxID=1802401 RepID=A0A1F7USP5_9BACT|nr:MAG: phosphoenolpyruvate mutase [Candidatus Uhrbacteria bacterium RIFCSPHIGHO2_02_FULL_46_47]OGL75408.1 MAG: phosphoenolpyruvate mutase [Candidatus Uhrbacteria bacterium RIFCSPHIGHO2_12_FULL_47_11]OGL81311.1 MAG: phosphoenolpyruvate mutase [Candidatus Uhrbacteria bacterium RIFCSPLOWO2_01_FULL_47_24]OGL83946.1 MAG: phosphoenolpyruvate mutase [Candidatus Uhrbacteria bacterium RIFCSPLOWO2_02_FULL_46_25]OGL91597.1 MAG: phosphoenolpyruvate mutase [Candidatus Uhrbacteria bacterium RIFCSPLOWO2_12_F
MGCRIFMKSKAAQLRDLLTGSVLNFLMEAHNGLSAKIVEEAGFAGIWASGLTMSAGLGVRDNNEASWTQVLEVLEFMSDATTIPILVDGDTGYGDFNSVRRLVKKLEQRGVAGLCIEDKLFPKTNSFIKGETQPLAEIEEFSGKIKAAKDTQQDSNFCVVARVEALIAGWGLQEAMRRAEAYHAAGADAILIHSKKKDAGEIFEFAKSWDGRAPLIIVPTMYYSTPTEQFRAHKVSIVIWANHLLRAAVSAMQQTASTIYKEESLMSVEDHMVPVQEIFRLQKAEELIKAEEKYLKSSFIKQPNAIILAASRGSELGELTQARPKAMLPVGGKPILARLVEDFRSHNIRDITVVAGYRPETINIDGIELLHNPDFEHSKDLATLACALQKVKDNTLIMYGDLLLRRYIVRDLLESDAPITIVVDSNVRQKITDKVKGDYVVCNVPDDRSIFRPDAHLVKCLNNAADNPSLQAHGQWIGALLVSGTGQELFKESIKRLQSRPDFSTLSVTDLLDDLVAVGHPPRIMYVSGNWLDVNNLPDVERASAFTQGVTYQRQL